MEFPDGHIRTSSKMYGNPYRFRVSTGGRISELLRILQVTQLPARPVTTTFNNDDVTCAYITMCPASKEEKDQGFFECQLQLCGGN